MTMNHSIRISLSALALAVGGLASAAPIAFDNFDAYAAGSAIAGKNSGTGWAGAWTGSAGATVTATEAGDAPMSGNALSFIGNDNNAASRALGAAVSSNVWVDFMFQFDGGQMNNNDFLGLWFGQPSGSNTNVPNIGLKTNCGGSGGSNCTADLFVRLSGTGGTYTTDVSIRQTYRMVGHLQKANNASTYNRFDLWVNPSESDLADLGSYDVRATGSTALSSFSTIGWRTAELDNSPQDRLLIDRLGLYTSAPLQARNDVPEPGSLALAALALGLAGATARRSKRG